MRVCTESLAGSETATIGVWIDAGSRFEDAKTNGTAHFLEHLSFKGTQRRTQSDIELEVENMGGHLNAYTSREQTAYYAKVLKNDVGKAVDILADILQHSKLDPKAIERERDVILREQEEVEKNMEEVIFDHLHAVAFQGTNLGRTILGSRENIKTINKGQLENYIKANYVGPRMVVAAAGAVHHDEICEAVEKAFQNVPRQSTLALAHDQALYTGAELRIPDDTMPHAHMAIAVQGTPWTSPDYWPLLVAQAIVGSWNRGLAGAHHMASPLAQAVSKDDLALSYQSFNTSYSDIGLFGVYMISDKIYDLDDLVYELQQEWVRICLGATEEEVQRAKQQLKSVVLMSLDGTTAIAEDIGRQVLALGRRWSWPEVHALIDAVEVGDVKRVASEYLYDRDPAVVGIGRIGSMPDYNRIRTATQWHRN
jgi:processing peptidase subunit beta